jgi:hypothetical protein
MIMQPGHFAVYGQEVGLKNLGKARATMNGQITTSDHPGVSWHAGLGHWQARIGIANKDVYLGLL